MRDIRKYRGLLTHFNDKKFIEMHYDDYIEIIEFSKNTDFENCKLEQLVYNWLYDISELPKTKCGNIRAFVSLSKGYNMFCKKHCNCMKIYNKEKREKTCIEKYGVTNTTKLKEVKEKMKSTMLENYGVECSLQSEKIREKGKQTNIEKYGKEYAQQSNEVKEKIRKTNLERYGVDVPAKSKDIQEKMKKTNLERYGVENVFQNGIVREKIKADNFSKYGTTWRTNIEKIKETCLTKYGVEYACMRPEARQYSNNSMPNRKFEELLKQHNIIYAKEFALENYSYDFKIDDILIEINPTITHNVHINIFGDEPMSKDYHLNKTECARKNKFRCIHIWDWDDLDKIVNMLKPKETLYARNLEIKEVPKKECDEFLNAFHLQNTCKEQTIRYGLYKNDVLIQIMTFGKPRYNKNYEYELLRLCSHKDYKIVGGAEKIFKYILDKYKPESIISYCDNSKFTGLVYEKLGFEKHKSPKPSKHWYNTKTKQHITDNLLRQRGFDQLFNANYGKGTSNEELMIEYNFLTVYDCGQMTFIFTNLSKE